MIKQKLPDNHRLKRNIVDVQEHDVWDYLIGLSHFGRADINDLHIICTDWEVYDESIEGAVVTLGVDGMIPMGGE